MTQDPISVRALSPAEARAFIPALSAILIDCVDGGASVSFMAPLSEAKARAFWQGVAEGVAAGERILFAASNDRSGDMLGTVQVILRQPENQPHRADVAKMLVLRKARRHGLGARLMRAAEAGAREAGKTLLVLDTVSGTDAARLYERLGWIRAGEVPGYALWPDGRPCPTTFYYRSLA